MSWSLNYVPAKEEELPDRFFLSAGKALYLASSFEAKCRYVLQTFKLVDSLTLTSDFNAAVALAHATRDKGLCQVLERLKGFMQDRTSVFEILMKAKDARNFIAHECAQLGPVSSLSSKHIYSRMEELRQQVQFLAAGDNIVSGWEYEIDEKEPAPSEIKRLYPSMVERWVFGNVGPDLDSGRVATNTTEGVG